MKKKLQVEAIEHGTVIDHIPAGQGIKILNFFELASAKQRITVGLNLPSNQGQKDLIKVEETVFTQEQADQLALFAPHASINLIENFEVVKKFSVSRPKHVVGVLDCPNSNCISHNEPISSRFATSEEQEKLKFKCHYCEKTFASQLFKVLD